MSSANMNFPQIDETVAQIRAKIESIEANFYQAVQDLESDEACLRQLRHTPLLNNILEERILLNQKVKQGYQLVYALMKLRVLVEEQLEMKLKGIKK
jgi:hypothetical protein